MASPQDILKTLLDVGLKAANPYQKILENLPPKPKGRLFVLAIGKAAAPMAKAAANFYKTGFTGILFVPKGYTKKVSGFEVYEGTHPVPSEGNVTITKKIMAQVEALGEGDLLLALISGGTSALLCVPKGVTLEEKISETKRLLVSGIPVEEINIKRTAMSAVKGGKLAKLTEPAGVETLIVSDVANDDPLTVGSAPTGGGKIILKSSDVLKAVSDKAVSLGISVSDLGQVEGLAEEAAKAHSGLVRDYYGKRPHLFVSGGETTVKVTGKGKGGRNTHYALALALACKGMEGVWGLAVDTDGHDGTGPFAGAWFGPETIKTGKDPEKMLKENDSGGFFEEADGLIVTGPTMTNVNDLRMFLLI